jgi:hypothetical protein
VLTACVFKFDKEAGGEVSTEVKLGGLWRVIMGGDEEKVYKLGNN